MLNVNKWCFLPPPIRAVMESAVNTKTRQYVAGHPSNRKGIVLKHR